MNPGMLLKHIVHTDVPLMYMNTNHKMLSNHIMSTNHGMLSNHNMNDNHNMTYML